MMFIGPFDEEVHVGERLLVQVGTRGTDIHCDWE